jgi:type IX secretion system PorP/SprF family membrane protein
MNKRLGLFFSFLLSYCGTIAAQQLPLFAQHPEFHGTINPASLNSDFMTGGHTLSAGLSMRRQWQNLGKASPTTQILRGEHINYDNNFLIGGYLMNDRAGITQNMGAYVRAAYVLPLGDDLTDGGFSGGLNIGLAQWALRTDRLDVTTQDDPDLPQNPTSLYPDIGIGLFAYKNLGNNDGQYLYGGFSMPRTFELRRETFGVERLPHFYGLVGYYQPINNGYLELSSWVRAVQRVPMQATINFRMFLFKTLLLGAGVVTDFQTKPFFMPEIAFNIPMGDDLHNRALKIGYSFVMGGSFRNYFGSSHEINLAFVMDTRSQ